jgi:hypothetical protein
MDLKAQKILDQIRLGRECNIKTLNTIDTMTSNTITLNTKHQHTFAQESVMLADTSLPSSGLASLSAPQVALEENGSSQVLDPPAEITYISASLKVAKTTRRTLNMDFRLSSTPAGEFNKLVFNLTDRHREFFANIPVEHHNDWEYQSAWEHYHSQSPDAKWIGKGRPRTKFNKSGFANAAIELGLAAVLEQQGKKLIANVWIDGIHRSFELKEVVNERYPYRYDSGSALEKVKVLPRRSNWK